MTHNSTQYKQSKRGAAYDKEDDYVYPTKKGREHKTRNRRSGKNQIRKGLVDLENQGLDDFKEKWADDNDWYDDTLMASDEDIAKEFGDDQLDGIDEASIYDSLHDDLMEDPGYDWEDY